LNRLYYCIFSVLLILSSQLSADIKKGFIGNFSSEIHPTEYLKTSDFSLLIGSLKYANLGFQYQYNHRLSSWLTVQGMLGFNTFDYRIFSASDEHRLRSVWIPISVGSRVHVIRKPKLSSYLFGKYGWAFGVGSGNHSVKSNVSNEYGIGALSAVFNRQNILLKTEIGRQGYTLEGRATSSFQSIIDYDLKFTSYFLRVGFAYVLR